VKAVFRLVTKQHRSKERGVACLTEIEEQGRQNGNVRTCQLSHEEKTAKTGGSGDQAVDEHKV